MGWSAAKVAKTFGIVQCAPKLVTSFATQGLKFEEALELISVGICKESTEVGEFGHEFGPFSRVTSRFNIPCRPAIFSLQGSKNAWGN
jgi:hypothetical protein